MSVRQPTSVADVKSSKRSINIPFFPCVRQPTNAISSMYNLKLHAQTARDVIYRSSAPGLELCPDPVHSELFLSSHRPYIRTISHIIFPFILCKDTGAGISRIKILSELSLDIDTAALS